MWIPRIASYSDIGQWLAGRWRHKTKMARSTGAVSVLLLHREVRICSLAWRMAKRSTRGGSTRRNNQLLKLPQEWGSGSYQFYHPPFTFFTLNKYIFICINKCVNDKWRSMVTCIWLITPLRILSFLGRVVLVCDFDEDTGIIESLHLIIFKLGIIIVILIIK